VDSAASSSHQARPYLAVTGLTKTYGSLVALDDVSLTVREGEVLGLIGPNGAGKTTLFECLAGVEPTDRGTVRVQGEVLPRRQMAERLFYLPDGIAPWPAQTVQWALDFTIGFFGGSPDRLADVVARLQLEPLLDAPLGTLSKGQRKRAVLAIGLLAPQPLLLTDEPFDGLDLRQSREVGGGLRDHVGAGRTLFLSIHSISEAARVCDRFVLLSAGRVCGEGTLEELTDAARERSSDARTSSLEDVFLALT
jgi:ABC-2 type transport system ATP-binding protein